MKKFLFLAIAALGFAACTEKGLENSDQNGELEQSYVAITLAADDMSTKATDGKYEAGLPVERKVESAYVFFHFILSNPIVALQKPRCCHGIV